MSMPPSGTSGQRFSYGSGPVFRMVVALGPDGMEGYSIYPVANPDSPTRPISMIKRNNGWAIKRGRCGLPSMTLWREQPGEKR